MNCYCSPPLPVQQRTVTKSGNNFGKIFFNCSQSKCKFFCWMDDTMNHKLYTTKKISSTIHEGHGGRGQGGGSSGSTNTSKLSTMKLMVGEIESGPPFRVWFDAQCPIDQKIRTFYNTIPEDKKRLNSKTKMWSFNFEIYDQFVSTLHSSEYSSVVQLAEIPRFLVNGIKKFLSSEAGPQEISLLGSMMDTILPFQLEAVEFVVRRGGRALIADEMGCGKTIEAIAVLQQYRQHLPALILCPPSLSAQWRGELIKFCEDLLEPSDICTLTTSTDRIYGKACIMPYSLLDRFVNSFSEERRFGIVIADESHNLKSKDAKRTCLALPLLKSAKVALCLTGTPAVNRPVELYTQLHGLLPEVFRDYDGFTNRYCDPKPAKFGPKMDVSGSSNEAELKNLLEGMVMIRRMKSDVINNLPTKSREVRRVKPDSEYIGPLAALQAEMKKNKSAIFSSSNSSDTNEFLNNQSRLMLTKLCGLTGMSKINKVVLELEKLIEEAREARINDVDSSVFVPEKQQSKSTEDSAISLAIGPTEIDILNESIHHENLVDLSREETDLGERNEFPINIESEVLPNAKEEGLIDSEDEDISPKKRKSDVLIQDDDDDDIFFCRRPLGLKDKKSMTQKVSSDSGNFDDKNHADWRDILDFSHTKVGKSKRSKASKQAENDSNPLNPLGKKILVFAHHHDVLDAIESCVRRKGVGYIRIDGTITGSARTNLISRFQRDPEIDVAILSITACGTGLNLTCANVALFAELHWSVGYMLQAEDRIHRLGQKSKNVRIIYILAEGTSDDIVWEQILRKHKILAATVGVDSSSMYSAQKVTVRDIKISPPDHNESQSTLDSFVFSSSDPVPEARIQPTIPKQQTSLDSFFTKKVPSESSIIFERENDSLKESTLEMIPPPMPSSTSFPGIQVNPRPFEINSSLSHLEPNVRFESKSSPLPQPSLNSGELSPNTKAKIEANRLRALARRNQILAQKALQPATAVIPSPVPDVSTSSFPEQDHVRRPTAINSSTYPLEVTPLHPSTPIPQSNGHIFSTGAGQSIKVYQDAIDRASNLIATPQRKFRSID